MGFSISWFAIQGQDPATIRQELGLHATGQFDEVPDWPICGAQLPTGWYLIFNNCFDHLDARWNHLSAESELIACQVEEHVMVSEAIGWSRGQEVWSIKHYSQRPEGIYHLETTGILPAVYVSVHDRLMAEQDRSGGRKSDVDYVFDIPLEVARAITGFKHDEDTAGAVENPFERLEQLHPPAKRFWQFWK